MYKLRLTLLQHDILEFLFVNAGTPFTGHALAKMLKVSQPGISKALPGLEKEDLITVRKDRDSKRLSIELNRNSQFVIGLKRAYNIRRLYESGLAAFLEEQFPGTTVILFGSYSHGDDVSGSDMDIAIVGRKKKDADLSQYESALHRKINLNFYDKMGNIHKELRENLCNGIVLAGGIEL